MPYWNKKLLQSLPRGSTVNAHGRLIVWLTVTLSATPTGWVVLGDMAGDGLGTRPSVAFQRTNRGVPRASKQASKQDRRVGPIFGSVGRCRVTQLVQGPAVGRLAK